jgi:hypothetical protein
MYKVLLRPGDAEFESRISLNVFHRRNDKLRTVLDMLQAAQRNCSQLALSNLMAALYNWRNEERDDYRARGEKEGIAYRLWMEAKQWMRNVYRQDTTVRWADPPMPPGCPGSFLVNTFVPSAPEGDQEVCHAFAYRWAIAAGKIQENPAFPAAGRIAFNFQNAAPVLYPLGLTHYPSARSHGVMSLMAGDIVAMYETLANHAVVLGHSLIAVTPTDWFGANNVQTFGKAPGRTSVTTLAYAAPSGWIGSENEWRRVADPGIARVVYRRN